MNIAKDLFFAQQSLMTLFLATNKLQMHGDKHLKDLTIRQILAIPALFHAPDGKATINHIARSMGTTKQSAKQIVDAMKKKGYLCVAASEQDKRAVNIEITPEGKQAFRKCSERTDEFLANIFCDFTAEELETLCMLLQKLYGYDTAQNNLTHGQHHANDSDAILQHHQKFAKLRAGSYPKEDK